MGLIFFLPVRLASEIRKLPPDLPAREFPGDWKLPLLRLPSRDGSPSSFVSLFIFYILSYLLSKTMGCFSGRLMTSASDQKLFCEGCSVLNCSFHEFVGEKVVSPSCSSAFLAPPSHLLISWGHSTSEVILEPKKMKSVTISTFSPSLCHEVMGLDAMILGFEC